MIISASYKTDIPTFYGDWFMNRLRAGFCKMVNPYGRQVYEVSLRRDDVGGIVFWTKNIAPFMSHLRTVREMGFPFIVQHTINGYPRSLETSVVDAGRSIENARLVCSEFGPRVLIWRYDPIVYTTVTPRDFHIQNFARLAESLRGVTDEVIISFAQVYAKTKRNLDKASQSLGLSWRDPAADEKRNLVSTFVEIARANEMQLTVCSQRDLIVSGAAEARCVDARRIEDISGINVSARLKGNRKECGCFESRDIGDYDTCPHGCVYCYAVQNRVVALQRYRHHDPKSDFLFEPANSQEPPLRRASEDQFPLFKDR